MTAHHSEAALHDINGDVTEVLSATVRHTSKENQDVYEFHKKFGLLHFRDPGHLSREKLRERVEFLVEELLEFANACGLAVDVTQLQTGHYVQVKENGFDTQDLAGQADALVDLAYVTHGTAVMLGLPWDDLWDDVQRANMSKVRGVTKRGHAVDVTKPPGWVGPKTNEILVAHGYNQQRWFEARGLVDSFKEEEGRDDVQR